MWHHSSLLMNSFNKTEAAVFLCRLCLLGAFPFISSIVLPVKRVRQITRSDLVHIIPDSNIIKRRPF